MRKALVALCGVLALGACGQAVNAEDAGWREMAVSPLGPREQTLGLWTGREVLLIGGSDEKPCPPAADCPLDASPLADGAALDPDTNRWRPIAASPVPLLGSGTHGVVIGSTAYVLPYAARPELLEYRIDKDAWKRRKTPFSPQDGYLLVAVGDRLVAYQNGDEFKPGKDYLFDPRTSAWTALPADPLGPAWGRGMAWTGRELMLFDHELIPNPGAEGPTLARVAALDLDAGSWRRLPDAPLLSTEPWLLAGGRLVNPSLGGADGGKIGNWGRTYPNGGSIDAATGAWSPLPDPPGGDTVRGGARTGTTALYPGIAEWVLDTEAGTWQRVPSYPGGDVTGHTVVAAGARMLVFGGVRWKGGTLQNSTWVWTP